MVSGTVVTAFDNICKTVKAVLFVQFAGPVNIHNENVKKKLEIKLAASNGYRTQI